MIKPIALTDPFTTTWYHGTNAARFSAWQCPPPSSGVADVSHSGLFFSANKTFAKGAGENVCTVKLSQTTKLIVPAHKGSKSTALRLALTKSSPVAAHCHWLTDDAVWTRGWSTGEALRFAYDTTDSKAASVISMALANVANNLTKIVGTSLPNEIIARQAINCLTRGWIEQVVREARKLGYQAIHGAEIDRGRFGDSAPIPQPWLAVMDASIITTPAWQ